MKYKFNETVVSDIQEQYTKTNKPWYLGFSGGKDSSAVTKLLFLALQGINKPSKKVTIIYCDTGVEIPIARSFAIKTLTGIKNEAQDFNIPIEIKIAIPELKDRYFVKVIGRGYPPPTNKFRWCTNRLRINPIKNILNKIPEKQGIVLLGIRKGESATRDKTIIKHSTASKNYFHQSSYSKVLIYSPIISYSTEEVWATLVDNPIPKSINATELFTMYKQASGECPVIRDPKGTPCGQGRFGCWTCTVISRDHAVEGLVNEGHKELEPLLIFRNWLAKIRNEPYYRCNSRRNGQEGLGPLTLEARKEILSRLLDAENKSGLHLIDEMELNTIYDLWELDKASKSYLRLEKSLST